MLVLGLDLETTGLDTQNDEIIELGAVVWDTERKVPVKMYSELVQASKPLPEEITQITGIQQVDLDNWGVSPQEAMLNLEALARHCSHIVAHNGRDFDQVFVDRYLAKHPEVQVSLPWIDTMTDLPYGDDMKTRKLTYLAAEHGFLNPFAHRSLFDVLSMMRVFSHYKLEEVLELSSSPMVRVVAHVSFEEKDKAKALGFRWDPARKEWFTGVREIQAKRAEYPFSITCEVI